MSSSNLIESSPDQHNKNPRRSSSSLLHKPKDDAEDRPDTYTECAKVDVSEIESNRSSSYCSSLCCQCCSGFSWPWLKKFLIDNFLPIGLIVAVVLGALWPTPGLFLNHPATQYVAVSGIFLVSGLFLKTDDMKSAMKSYLAVTWGIVSILFVTSGVGITLIGLFPYDHTSYQTVNSTRKMETSKGLFGPEEVQRGLQVFFSAPCTVSTGVIMVTQLGGNYALALILTVVCNILGTFTVPLMINWLVKFKGDVSLDIGPLLLKLTLTIFLPTMVGKALQYIKKVKTVTGKVKVQLKLLSIILLLLLPWIKISEARSTGQLERLNVVSFILVVCVASLVHVCFLIINALASFVLRFNTSQRRCIVILASQKTLAVSLSVVNFLPSAAGAKGLLIIPLIISHFTIIMIDSLLVVVWAKLSPAYEEAESKE